MQQPQLTVTQPYAPTNNTQGQPGGPVYPSQAPAPSVSQPVSILQPSTPSLLDILKQRLSDGSLTPVRSAAAVALVNQTPQKKPDDEKPTPESSGGNISIDS